MNLSKLSALLADEPKYRYAQANQALWQDFISAWEQASVLPKALRERLEAECPLEIRAELSRTTNGRRSDKALISLADGETASTTLIQQKGKPAASDLKLTETAGRNTVLVSSQSEDGRQLQAEEMIEQVVFWARRLKAAATAAEKVDNIIFTGGEPFRNYAEFIKAVKFLNNPETLNIGARRISATTAGIVDGIKRLASEKLQINLAVALYATTDEKRRDILPAAPKDSLPEILRAVDSYILKTGRRVMFEYPMIKGVNDSEAEARELAVLMDRPLYLVNLIPYNPIGGKFQPSERARIDDFKQLLDDSGVPATVRLNFGA